MMDAEQRKRKRNRKNLLAFYELSKVDDAVGFSKLPNDVIVEILSRMTRKEASRTSVLSRRWRYLWLFTSRILELDDRTVFSDLEFNEPRRKKFVAWVSRVLKLHRGRGLDGLIIRFAHFRSRSFSRRRPGYIDNWIYFAMDEEVKMLELNFAHDGTFHPEYEFPGADLLLSHSRDGKFGFRSLRALILVGVDIEDEVVEYFSDSCPCLEKLCITRSDSTKNLRLGVVDSLPNLKVLEISDCPFIRTLEIYAKNLVSCTYQGEPIPSPFKEIQNLSELTLGGNFAGSFINKPLKHSSYSPQLVKLTLNIPIFRGYGFPNFPTHYPELPRLSRLERLELNVMSPVGRSLYFFTSLIKASPLLNDFTIRLCYTRAEPLDSRRVVFPYVFERDWCLHKNLKTVKMSGYVGCSRHDRFVLRLLEIAPSLETVTIDTESEYYDQKPWACTSATSCTKERTGVCICTMQGTGARTRIEAKDRAERLKFQFPPTIVLTIM